MRKCKFLITVKWRLLVQFNYNFLCMDKIFYSVHGKTKAVTPALIRIVHVVKLDNRKRESFSVDSGSINLIFI